MIRTLFGVLAGVVVGGAVIACVELISMLAFPHVPALYSANREAMAAMLPEIPLGMLLTILLAWSAGSLGGAWTGARIAPRSYLLVALTVGLALWASGIILMLSASHPLWFWMPGLLMPIPCALLGARLARPRPAS